jgi:HEPN domain-containing protein
MGNVDLDRAEALLKSAKSAYATGDIRGVAGLSYHALEAAASFLIETINGHDPGGHGGRMRRVSELLSICNSELDRVWRARNVDFYGNENIGEPKRLITMEEVRDSLETAERVLGEIKSMANGPP